MKNNNIKVGTDFSGIGSPEQALTNLGIDYESVFACEIDKFARQSYSAIHKKPKTFYTDITKRDHSEVEQLDLYIAGFPCQTFSLDGNRKGFDDVRGTLFFDVADFIRTNRPKTFILENVKGLVSHDNGSTFQTIISLLTDNGGTANGQMSIPYFDDGLGYHVYYCVMNSKHHGVPQNRERIFIVGFRDFRTFTFPKPEPLNTKLKNILESVSDEKYILSSVTLNKLRQGYINDLKTNDEIHEIRIRNATSKGYDIAKEGDSIYLGFPNSKTRRGRIGRGIARTLDTESNQAVLSQHRIRRLTPLECWRLQSFPDEQFKKAEAVCSDTQLYKQAGNSITVAVIQKLIKKILCL